MAKAKTTAAKKPAAAKVAKAAKADYKPLTKTQILQAISEETSVSKKDVDAVLASLSALIAKSLKADDKASFTLPGLIKIEKQFVAAQPEKKGVDDPFNKGRKIDIPAKPAHYKVKVKALKALKDMA